MSKILVTCQEREIVVKEFDTLQEAQETMLSEFKECPDFDEWEEDFELDNDTGEYCISKTSGYANADDGDLNIDWGIYDVSKPYVLITCQERELSIQEFDSLKEAQETMLANFKECSDYENCWKEDFELNDDTGEYCISETSGYANADNGDLNIDWFIYERK